MIDIIFNLAELPQGYFRIHWPQSQVLMDDQEYQKDVILCMGEAEMFDLSTVALPERYKELLSPETRAYIENINSFIK